MDRRGSSTDQYAAAKGTSFASVTPMPRQKPPNLAMPRPYNAMFESDRHVKLQPEMLQHLLIDQHPCMTCRRIHITAPA